MSRDRWLWAWAVASVALGTASLLVPLYFVSLGGDAVALGLLAGVGAAAGAPGALLAGRFVDRTGRRRPVVLGVIGAVAVVLAVTPLVRTPSLLILVNGLLWFAAGAAAPVLTLMVTAGHDESTWSERFGTMNVYAGWGWAGGLVLGTVWTTVGSVFGGPLPAQRTLLVACAVAAGLGVVLGARWLPADDADVDSPDERVIARSMARSRRIGFRSATFPVGPGRLYWLTRSVNPRRFVDRVSPALALYLVAVTATFLGYGVFWGPLPLYLSDGGYTAGTVFAFYLLSSLGSALWYGAAGRLANRRDPTALNAGAVLGRSLLQPAVAVVGLLTTATVAGLIATGLTFVLIGVCWAVIAVTGTLIVTARAPVAIRGQALGLYTAVSGLANGIGAVLGGWLAAWDFSLSFAVSGILVFGGALVVLVLRRRTGTKRAVAVDGGPA